MIFSCSLFEEKILIFRDKNLLYFLQNYKITELLVLFKFNLYIMLYYVMCTIVPGFGLILFVFFTMQLLLCCVGFCMFFCAVCMPGVADV